MVDKLFRELGERLSGFLRASARNPQDAADLFQDVYARMRAIPNAETIRNPEGYLFAVARNLMYERIGDERRQRNAADVDDPLVEAQLADVPDFCGEIETERRVAQLRTVLQELPARWQAAVKMCHMDGMSYEAAAARLGVSTNSVKKYLKKALAHCRCRMTEPG
ncbi:MAG TPA: RNA polymerase sigma factor [Steroidobacteraceae bacterium]|nr:RNA polymerase sigma factor [Steroidobacteraceae bacterium]